ncbi:MAG: fatty acid desaturase CarF family protein [Pseudomonadota bacterium]|nr:fatty acid desaturase CarF family protein [Pseudomonadota bacterium]
MNPLIRKDLLTFITLLSAVMIMVSLCLALWLMTDPQVSMIAFVLSVPIALYLADFVSGVMHFIIDYVPQKKGVGLDRLYYFEGSKNCKEYIQLRQQVMKKAGLFQQTSFFFKHHHLVHPKTIAIQPLFNNFLPTLPMSLLFFMLAIIAIAAQLPDVLILILILSSLIVFFAQYLHAVTHGRSTPRLIRFLQEYHVLLNRQHHAKHHKTPDQYFCFVNGWADPLVNFIVRWVFRQGWLDRDNLAPPEKEFVS